MLRYFDILLPPCDLRRVYLTIKRIAHEMTLTGGLGHGDHVASPASHEADKQNVVRQLLEAGDSALSV